MKRLITFLLIAVCSLAAFADNKALVSQLKKTKIYSSVKDYENCVSAKEKNADTYHLFLPDGTEIYICDDEWCKLKSVEQYGGRNYYRLKHPIFSDRLVNDQGVLVSDLRDSERLVFYDMSGMHFFIKSQSLRETYIDTKILRPDGSVIFEDTRFGIMIGWKITPWTDGKNVYFYLTAGESCSLVDIEGNVLIPPYHAHIDHLILGGESWFRSFGSYPGEGVISHHSLLFDSKGTLMGELDSLDSFIELDGHVFFIMHKLNKGFGGKFERDVNTYVYSPEFGEVMSWDKGDKSLGLATEDGKLMLVKTGAPTQKVALAPIVSTNATKESQSLVAQNTNPQVKSTAAKPSVPNVDSDIPNGSKKRPNTFALVIANENYRRIEPVTFAQNDGDIFRRYLTSTLGLPEENVLYVPDASLNDINYNLDRLAKICAAYDGKASVIVYYAGHGAPDDELKEACLLPTDGYAESPAKSGISMSAFLASLSAMPTQQTTVFIDACFSGVGREDKMLASARGVRIKPKDCDILGNLVVFTASQGDETAHPLNDGRHGLFTYYLLSKLAESRGDITLGELSDYITTSVKRKSAVSGKPQTPSVRVAPSNTLWRDSQL